VAELAADEAAAPVFDAMEEPAEAAPDAAELTTLEPLLLRLLASELNEEATLPVAVARDEVIEPSELARPLVADDSLDSMLLRTEVPSERMELMIEVPEARMPELVVV